MLVQSTNQWRRKRFELEGNLAERGQLASVGDLQVNTQKKTWQIMVNPGVDSYTKNQKPQFNGKSLKNGKKRQPTKTKLTLW